MSKFDLAGDGEIGVLCKYKLEQMKNAQHVQITTNFEINRKELDAISKTEGVDSFEQASRYVVKVIIGELFETAKIVQNLELMMARLIEARSNKLSDTEQAKENMKKVLKTNTNRNPWQQSFPSIPGSDGFPRRYG